MRRHPILWLLAGAYLLLVGLWPAAAIPLNVAAMGAVTVLLQPYVLLAAVAIALIASGRRRPAHAHTRTTNSRH
ncbi:MAG TPA: hypothetical protein VGL02_22625 [Streptomyces sp.]